MLRKRPLLRLVWIISFLACIKAGYNYLRYRKLAREDVPTRCMECTYNKYSLAATGAIVFLGTLDARHNWTCSAFGGGDICLHIDKQDSTRQQIIITNNEISYKIAIQFNHDSYHGNLLDTSKENPFVACTPPGESLQLNMHGPNFVTIEDSTYHKELGRYLYNLQFKFKTESQGFTGKDVEGKIKDLQLYYPQSNSYL